jgi:beta-glucosidase
VNYYTRVISRDETAPEKMPVTVERGETITEMDWEVYPDGLYRLLSRLYFDYQPRKLYVTENGASYSDGPDESGRIADGRRIAYLRDHVAAVHRTIESGIPVAGYFVWSLLDNFEWSQGYSQRFGIVWVDYETQARLPKDSALWYRDLIARNAL